MLVMGVSYRLGMKLEGRGMGSVGLGSGWSVGVVGNVWHWGYAEPFALSPFPPSPCLLLFHAPIPIINN